MYQHVCAQARCKRAPAEIIVDEHCSPSSRCLHHGSQTDSQTWSAVVNKHCPLLFGSFEHKHSRYVPLCRALLRKYTLIPCAYNCTLIVLYIGPTPPQAQYDTLIPPSKWYILVTGTHTLAMKCNPKFETAMDMHSGRAVRSAAYNKLLDCAISAVYSRDESSITYQYERAEPERYDVVAQKIVVMMHAATAVRNTT
eukprot:7198-Heterococcus_DN1.PRE.1